MSLLNTALFLCQKGLSLIPLGESGKSLKIPRLKTWRQYQVNGATEEQVLNWWTLRPNSNIGVLTGQLIVIDADSEDAVKLVESILPYTNAQVQTSRGRHFYYINIDKIPNQKITNTKIDVKSFGGYVVGPNCAHETGVTYTPVTPLDEWNIPDLTKLEFSRLHQDAWSFSAGIDPNGVVEEGARNNSCASLAGGYIRQGYNIDEIVDLLTEWNAANLPPLEAKEIIQTVQSVYKTHQIKNPMEEEFDSIPYKIKETSPEPDFFPKGLIGDIGKYIMGTANYPQPALACAASLCILGTLLGRKVQTNSGSRTNLYTICLADSGFGKEAPRKAIKDLLYSCNAITKLGGEDLGSSQGIFKAVEKSPSVLFLSDEFGHRLQSITNPKSGSYEREILATLMKLFSSADTVMLGRVLADEEKTRKDIIQPNVSLFATSTAEPLYAALSSQQVIDGCLNRMLIFKASRKRPEFNTNRVMRADPQLIKQLTNLNTWTSDEMVIEGNIPDVRSLNITQHIELNRELRAEETAHLERHESDSALWVRFVEHTHKLALIYTLSQDAEANHVTKEGIEWARDVVRWCFSNLAQDVEDRVSNSNVESDFKEALRYIRSFEGEGATKRDIYRKFKKWNVKTTTDILQHLLLEGSIKVVDRVSKGRPCKVYVSC